MIKKVRIRTLGRVISDLSEFGLYGVAGMLINGSLTIFWSTGRPATTTLEYGYTDSDPSGFSSITIPKNRKYHTVAFPSTYVDTDHYFRVRSTDPITGIEKVSRVYKVFVSSDFELESEIGGTIHIKLPISVNEKEINVNHNLSSSLISYQLEPNSTSEIGFVKSDVISLTMPSHSLTNNPMITTNILTTNIIP